jgi:hypothetical protein
LVCKAVDDYSNAAGAANVPSSAIVAICQKSKDIFSRAEVLACSNDALTWSGMPLLLSLFAAAAAAAAAVGLRAECIGLLRCAAVSSVTRTSHTGTSCSAGY